MRNFFFCRGRKISSLIREIETFIYFMSMEGHVVGFFKFIFDFKLLLIFFLLDTAIK